MSRYDQLANLIVEMGNWACSIQQKVLRSYKTDNSVLTEADTTINEKVGSKIRELFPNANVITEEALFPFNPDAPLTFILDPIDGTDTYSQGLPTWCLSLGILDENRKAVGAMLYAPRWGLGCHQSLFLRLDPNKEITLNGVKYSNRLEERELKQIVMPSNLFRFLMLNPFQVKMRSFGSNILHIVSCLLYPNIQASISMNCYCWDIASSHALLVKDGFRVCYHDSTPFEYDDSLLIERKPISKILLAGTDEAVEKLIKIVNEAPYNYLNHQ
ncbi:MAG: inositol monophosphatase family protein [Sphaerochaetaceae bacterium]